MPNPFTVPVSCIPRADPLQAIMLFRTTCQDGINPSTINCRPTPLAAVAVMRLPMICRRFALCAMSTAIELELVGPEMSFPSM